MISFKTKIKLQDFQDFNILVYKERWSFKMMQIVSIIFILMFFAMVYFSITLNEKLDWTSFGILIFALLYLFGIPWLLKFNAGKTFKNSPILQEEILFEISNSEIKTTAESYQSNFNWNEVYRVTENESALFIYLNKQSANLIPKADLSPEQLKELKEIIRSKNGFPIKLIE